MSKTADQDETPRNSREGLTARLSRRFLTPVWNAVYADPHIAVIELSGNGLTMEVRSFKNHARTLDAEHNRHKVKIPLSKEITLSESGSISQRTIDTLIHHMLAFRGYIKSHDEQGRKIDAVYCIATAPLRDAANSRDIHDQFLKEAHYNFHIAAPDYEARLSAAAILEYYPTASGLVIDMGAGSTEFALIENGEVLKTASLSIGTSTINSKSIALDALQTLDADFMQAERLIPIGGTFRACNEWMARKNDIETLKTPETYTITTRDYRDNLARLSRINDTDLAKLPHGIADKMKHINASQHLLNALSAKMDNLSDIQLAKARTRDGIFALITHDIRNKAAQRTMAMRSTMTFLIGVAPH